MHCTKIKTDGNFETLNHSQQPLFQLFILYNSRFIYVETAFFWKWWIKQHAIVKSRVRKLVNNVESKNDAIIISYMSNCFENGFYRFCK